MRLPTLQEIQWFTAIGAACGAAYPLARWLTRKGWIPVRAFFVGLHRVIAGFDTMQGEVSQIRRRVESELGPNGGGSLKDQVTHIAERQAIFDARQAAIFDGMKRPAFTTDANGNFISVNRAFETMTGYPARHLLGKGWVNLLHQDEVEDFMVAWEHTIRDGRMLRRSCRIVTAADIELDICVDAVPVKRGETVIEWQGSFDGVEGLEEARA